MEDIIVLPAYLSGFSSRTDGSAGIRLTTQELQPEDFAALQSHNGDFGTFYFRPNGVQEVEIKQEDIDESKTPSKRLRAVLYRLWEQNGKPGTFENYYREQMEKVIGHVKTKLD